jgi:hypothetical protein
MRGILNGMAVAGILLGTLCFGQQALTPMQMLKRQQKNETKELKLREKYEKQMMRNPEMSKVLRTQMKHQLEREKRDLKQRQKDQRQKLKDREQILKEGMKDIPSD